MISEIWEKLKQHRIEKGRDVALEVRMHPSVFDECMSGDYHEVNSAFSLTPSAPVSTMFGYPLAIDFDLDEGEWHVQTPRVKLNN